jgi:hypothetical protein
MEQIVGFMQVARKACRNYQVYYQNLEMSSTSSRLRYLGG